MQKRAMLYEQLPGESVHCFLCSHHCRINDGEFGFCGVRQNIDHELYTHVYGEVIAKHIDPVEKKPLYHFLPGTTTYSIGTVGCNFHCGFCQNWEISQAAEQAKKKNMYGEPLSPDDAVQEAIVNDCRSIAYTYTEPTIFFEYAADTAKRAREAGLKNIFVSNGYMTKETLDIATSWLDAANIDLKTWQENFYRETCLARLKPVLNTIRYLKELGIWVEITTLLIPGENDFPEDLQGMASFIAGVDPEIPWHISAFSSAYKFQERPATEISSMEQARQIGHEAGLQHVYLGNVPADNHTACSSCGKTVIQRQGRLSGSQVLERGICPSCGKSVAGVWE